MTRQVFRVPAGPRSEALGSQGGGVRVPAVRAVDTD
jgi:hypothetical protein